MVSVSFLLSLSLGYVFWDIWSWLAILEPFHGFCNHRQAHFSPAMRPWCCLGDNTVTPTASSTEQRSCRQKAGQLWERWFIVMDGLDHPPSTHRIWQEPNIPAVCQDFKGIEPPGFPQLIKKQELWSQLTDLLLGEKRNQRCFLTSSLSLVHAAASAVLTGAAPAHAELCPSHTPVPKLGGDPEVIGQKWYQCCSLIKGWFFLLLLVFNKEELKIRNFSVSEYPKNYWNTSWIFFLIVYLERVSWLSQQCRRNCCYFKEFLLCSK